MNIELQPEQIPSEPIAKAADALRELRKSEQEGERDLTHHRQTDKETAPQTDADADAKRRREGKPPLKGRPATEAAERKERELEHELRVRTSLREAAEADLTAAWQEHGDDCKASLVKEMRADDQLWSAAVSALLSLHGPREARRAVARALELDITGVKALPFERGSIENIETAPGSPRVGFIETMTVLLKLSELGAAPPEPDPVVEEEKGGLDFEGAAPESFADIYAGSPTQSEQEARQREWDAKHAR
jgi:hypothetical protein